MLWFPSRPLPRAVLQETCTVGLFARFAFLLGRRREAWTHLKLAVALAPSSELYRGALARIRPPDEPGTTATTATVDGPSKRGGAPRSRKDRPDRRD